MPDQSFCASSSLEAGQGQDNCATGSRSIALAMTRSALAKHIISVAALAAQTSARTGVLELLVALSALEWVAVRNNPDTSRRKRAVALAAWSIALTTFGHYQFRKRRLGQLSLLAILLLAVCLISATAPLLTLTATLDDGQQRQQLVSVWAPPALSASTLAVASVPIMLEYAARLSEGLGGGLRAWNGMAPA